MVHVSVLQQLGNVPLTSCRAAGRQLVHDGQNRLGLMQILSLEREVWRQCWWAYGSIDILVIPSSGDKRSASERRGFASKFKHRLEQLQDGFITYCTAAVGLCIGNNLLVHL